MKKVKITAIRKTCYPDLMEKYENPISHACDVEEGMVWLLPSFPLLPSSTASPWKLPR